MDVQCIAMLAYIDPATGALVLQALVALVLAIGVGFRKAIVTPFKLIFRRREQEPLAGESRPPDGDG